jgi:RNA polymerase sigma-70 factor (ECF subfamily)
MPASAFPRHSFWHSVTIPRKLTGTNVSSEEKSLQKVPPTDHELLAKMFSGDEDAFTTLYRRRQGPVYRFALQMTGSAAIAEDVTQEVFMALLSKTAKYDAARGSLASFLYGIARNLVLRRIEKTAEIEDYAGPEDILDDLTRRETVELVRRAVLSLPPVYREAVVLCDLQDTSYEDAAQVLDCPIGTVRSRLNRGRSMLAQKLAVKV